MSIKVINLTNFFNRELMMYSLGDIKFKKPIALKKVAYITVFLILWAIPIIVLTGFPTGPIKAIFTLVVPVVAGHIASKPVFGGKGLLDFLRTLFNYLGEPKGWLDLNSSKELDNEVFYVENEIWISRRREIEKLNKLIEGTN